MTYFTPSLVGQHSPPLGDKKAEQAGAWLQASTRRCPSAATALCCESQRDLPTLLVSASRTERRSQSGHYIWLSGQKWEVLRCMGLFGVGGKTSEAVMACKGQNAVCNPVCFPSCLCKFQLETRFVMKANGCDGRRTETPVKAKWIPPLTKLQSFASL